MRKSKKKLTNATAQVGTSPAVAVTTAKMTPREFTLKAIPKLRALKPYTSKSGELAKGIHSVYSGFNKAFSEYFGSDPVEAQKQMVANGDIETTFARGGVMLYLKGEKPVRVDNSGATALSAILS